MLETGAIVDQNGIPLEIITVINRPPETNPIYTTTQNTVIGVGEIITGLGVIAGGLITAAALAPETLGSSALIGYNSLIVGSTAIALGITRITGSNTRPFSYDALTILVPPIGAFYDIK